MFLVLVAIAIDRLCTLLPSDIYFDPFPLYDMIYCYADDDCRNIGINLQAYVKAITVHAAIIIFLFAIKTGLPQLARPLKISIIIEFLSLADYFILYEQTLFDLGTYHVEFTDFRIFGHAITILLWKSGRLS